MESMDNEPIVPRTSHTHPLLIAEVSCGPSANGLIGITFCPGKCGESVNGAPWDRDIELDLDAVKDWGATVAFTLIERHELVALGVSGLGEGFRSRGIDWHHLPIVDLRAPDSSFLGSWYVSGRAALDALRAGERVLVHCRGGLGRAGTVACLLLRELGFPAEEALRRVRKARPGAVETSVQERCVRTFAPRLGTGRL